MTCGDLASPRTVRGLRVGHTNGSSRRLAQFLRVPGGGFSSPSRVLPANGMPGGGMERTATGNIPVQILDVIEY